MKMDPLETMSGVVISLVCFEGNCNGRVGRIESDYVRYWVMRSCTPSRLELSRTLYSALRKHAYSNKQKISPPKTEKKSDKTL